MRNLGRALLLLLGAVAACSAEGTHVFGTGGAGGASSTVAGQPSSTSPSSSATSTTGQGGGPVLKDGGLTAAGVGGGSSCVNPGPNEDWDKDGWTIAEGDCNDCDPNVNPGALDTITTGADGGVVLGDEDCDGVPGEVPPPCDDGLAVDDADPLNAAKAVELCQPFTDPKKWGVASAKWVLPDGSDPSKLTPYSGAPMSVLQANYALGHGILSGFGPNVKVQAGTRMLGLSSGTARQPTDPGYKDVGGFDKGYTVKKPTGFIPMSPACPGKVTGQPHDAAALEVVVVAPTNAHGFSFNFNFFTYEWPEYICSEYNDYFLALLSPPPMGHPDGNISFDSQGNPVSVNNAFLQVCGCAKGPPCLGGGVKWFSCGLGDLSLVGTGFGADTTGNGDHGSTGWLETKAPISPHEELTLRWMVYDSGDGALDTTTLIDNFQWILDTGSPSIGTTPVPPPT